MTRNRRRGQKGKWFSATVKFSLARREHKQAGSVAKSRKAYFGRTAIDTPVLRMTDLSLGDEVQGPAIIEEPTTTIVIPPGARVLVRPNHYLIDVGGEHGD